MNYPPPFGDSTFRHAVQSQDLSISMAPGELQSFYLDLNSTSGGRPVVASPTIHQLQHQQQRRRLDGTMTTTLAPSSSSLLFGSIDSVANASIAAAAANRQRTDSLFAQFLDVVQSRSNESEIFATVRDLIQVCTDTLVDLCTLSGGSGGTAGDGGGRALASVAARDREDGEWLTKERETWRLLYALYKDRLYVQQQPATDAANGDGGGAAARAKMDMDEPQPLLRSDKDIVERLYAQNANLREYQLIVDWLEQSAAEQALVSGTAAAGCFTDRTVGWENTLLQLKNADRSMFGGTTSGGKTVVRAMDPDAPLREKRRLHDLDEEDQRRLQAQILREIRMGRIAEAQALCEHCGQPWQAAVLEGWRLHQDSNYERADAQTTTRKLAIEGNPRRDLWKLLAWRCADHAALGATQRAIAGILSGHLGAAVAGPLSNSWPDLLWAYLKVQIDLRVESEIRSCSARPQCEMPPAYWAGKMTLQQIFGELLAHDNGAVSAAARHPMHVIQRGIVLDSVPEMLAAIEGWLPATGSDGDAQQLRFLTHLVLFMRQIGRMPTAGREADVGDRCIRAYVECLTRRGADAQLVAFYVAAVPQDVQTVLYSRYLRSVTETAARRAALDEGQLAGLDVCRIAAHTVEVVRVGDARRQRQRDVDYDVDDEDDIVSADYDEYAEFAEPVEDDGAAAAKRPKQQAGTVSPADGRRISALEWLTFYAEQKGDLLWQACAMMRTFLAEERDECVRRAFEMVPVDAVGQLLDEAGGSAANLPYRDECSVKEYLCYQAYLGARDAYNEWTRAFHAKPAAPRAAAASAPFTERIAAEHREQTHRADLQRWRVALAEQTRTASEQLFGVLRFPDGGFLVDPEYVEASATEAIEVLAAPLWRARSVQLESLRKLCVPECVVLLHRVLHDAGEFKECVRLADELADGTRKLYAVFTKQRLAEVIGKLGESSLALMNEKLDPWGYATSG